MTKRDLTTEHNTLLKLAPLIDRNFILFCRNLEKLQRENNIVKLGYKDFESYCLENFGFGRRKSFYFLCIGRIFFNSNILDSEIDSIGWAKAKEFNGVPTEYHSELISFAKENNFDELKNEASRLRGVNVSTKRISIVLSSDSADLLEQALSYIGGTRSEAFMKILSVWADDTVKTIIQAQRR